MKRFISIFTSLYKILTIIFIILSMGQCFMARKYPLEIQTSITIHYIVTLFWFYMSGIIIFFKIISFIQGKRNNIWHTIIIDRYTNFFIFILRRCHFIYCYLRNRIKKLRRRAGIFHSAINIKINSLQRLS